MKNIVLFLMLSLLCACATQNFKVSKNGFSDIDNYQSGEPDYDKWSHFFINGIGQKDAINTSVSTGTFQSSTGDNLCSGKFNNVVFKREFLSIVFAYFGYTPMTYKIYCDSNK